VSRAAESTGFQTERLADGEQAIPDGFNLVGGRNDLESVFAGVAGAADVNCDVIKNKMPTSFS